MCTSRINIKYNLLLKNSKGYIPQNGAESRVVRYNGPRSFDCDAAKPMVAHLESANNERFENISCIYKWGSYNICYSRYIK